MTHPVLSSPSPSLEGQNQGASPCSVLSVAEQECTGGRGEWECGIGSAGHGASACQGTRESAGGRRGAAAPQPSRDTPAPVPSGWGEGLFFPTRFTASRKVSFWKPRLPARHSHPARCRLHARAGSPGTAGAGVHRVGLPWAAPGRDPPGRIGTAGCAHPSWCVSGSQGCGWDAAVPPAHAALPGSASPRRKERSCLKPHPDTHPRGIPVGLAGERGPA